MASPQALREARRRTTLLLNVASIVERADESVLPAVYLFIGRAFRVSLSDLGTLTACRAVVLVRCVVGWSWMPSWV